MSVSIGVVGNDEAARARVFKGKVEVFGIAFFVCVDEDEVKRTVLRRVFHEFCAVAQAHICAV